MKKWSWIFVLLILFPVIGKAQCAMCKAIVETSQQAGSPVAVGLNNGILYLMVFPYLLIGGAACAIYCHKKQSLA